jgi:hypothetical protein
MSRAARSAYNSQQNTANNLEQGVTQTAGNISGIASKIPTTLTPEQQAAYLNAQEGGIDTGFNNASAQAANFASRTGATAGVPELQAQLAKQATQAKANAAGTAQLNLMNVPLERQQLQAQLYGNAGQLQQGAYGTAQGSANALTGQAFAPGLASQLLTGLAGAVGPVGAAAIGKWGGSGSSSGG